MNQPPGWYPDPWEPSNVRYWDGGEWRQQAGPPPPAAPPRSPLLRSPRAWWVVGGIAAVVVALVAIGLLVTHRTEPSVSKAGSGGASGSRDDWLAAVCQPGWYQSGGPGIAPNAIGEGFCSAAVKSGNPNASVFVFQFDSDYLMRNDLQALQMTYFAATEQGGVITVFAVNQSTKPAALNPLVRFGFQIEDVPRR